MKIQEEIIKYYERYDESKRLASDIGPLELVRTQELIKRFLPSLPAVILDVGGATGIYSYWLAAQKYTVHLVDIVPRHIERAKAVAEQADSPKLASLRVGDARKLDFRDGYADMVMLHGPLYHLADKRDRLVAIAEAKRVLKAGGLLLAFAITRYAGLIYGLTKGLVFNRDYLRMITTEVETGQRVDPPPGAMTFPNAYFHLPQELEQELTHQLERTDLTGEARRDLSLARVVTLHALGQARRARMLFNEIRSADPRDPVVLRFELELQWLREKAAERRAPPRP